MKLMSENNRDEQIINKIVSLMQSDESFDAPADSVQWAKNLFRSRAVEPKKSVVQRIFAVLQMDLSPGKAAYGERSGAGAAARQMFFQAGDNALDLRVSKNGRKLKVQGQILGAGFANCTVKLASETASYETQASERSEFDFNEIPLGEYDLILRGEDNEIFIEKLSLS